MFQITIDMKYDNQYHECKEDTVLIIMGNISSNDNNYNYNGNSHHNNRHNDNKSNNVNDVITMPITI